MTSHLGKIIGLTPLVESTLQSISEMYQAHEAAATQQAWIQEYSAVLTRKLELEQEQILRYYELRFAERHEALQEFYDLLHQAVASGNNQHLLFALQSILGIIKLDPLADYDQFVVAYRDTNHVLEI